MISQSRSCLELDARLHYTKWMHRKLPVTTSQLADLQRAPLCSLATMMMKVIRSGPEE